MKKAILMMGLPGAGKSTVRKQLFGGAEWTVLDSDEIKKTLPGYDPKNPGLVHPESQRLLAIQTAESLGLGLDVVIDSTGTNAERMVNQTRTLQAKGYHVTLVYVAVSLATSIARNARRERTVAEYIIREKAEVIATSFEIVARYVDQIEVVNND